MPYQAEMVTHRESMARFRRARRRRLMQIAARDGRSQQLREDETPIRAMLSRMLRVAMPPESDGR